MLRKIYYLLKPQQRLLLRRLVYLPIDLFDIVAGKTIDLVPPKGITFTGSGDFARLGAKFANKIISDCNLQPQDKILDIGCGIGRLARPLTLYLSVQGGYYGFDIVDTGVQWCNYNYRRFPNFHFKHIPLKNDLYNTSAVSSASAFRFPYDDNFFDAAASISVFTHLQQDGLIRYMSETSRVLKQGAACFCTFFVISKNRQNGSSRKLPFFRHNYGDYYLHDNRVKDANIAYTYDAVERMAERAGLSISSVQEGWWYDGNKDQRFDFQDVIVFVKK